MLCSYLSLLGVLPSQGSSPDWTKLPWPPSAAPRAPWCWCCWKLPSFLLDYRQPPNLQTVLVPLALESGETDTSPSSSPLKAWSAGAHLMFSSPPPWDEPRQPVGGQSQRKWKALLTLLRGAVVDSAFAWGSTASWKWHPHSGVLTWRVLWMKELSGLQSKES